jgi:glycosyltransferase 2 family protein
VIVCVGVSGTVRHALAQLAEHKWELRPAWLAVSGAVFVLGLMPMGWFWYRVLAALRHPAPLLVALRAYFLSQLGKYVPGKAMVVILRVAAVRRWAPSMRIAIVSVFLETLTMMAVGAFLAFVLSALVLKSDVYISLIALGMAVAAGVPTLPPLVRWFARLGIARTKQVSEPQALDLADSELKLRGITFGLLAEGWIAASVCWVLLGISLWATLRAIGVEQMELVTDLPVLITAVAFAVVAGFFSMLPGGLVVRDAVLMQLLSPVCGEANALVAAVMMRLVWLVSEVVACGILYIGRGRWGQTPEVRDQGIQ